MLLGAHQSVAGGMDLAVERAVQDGCDTFQVFTTSSRQWKARHLPDDEIRRFRRAVRRAGLGPVAAHASYLINLSAPPGPVRDRSIAALREEIGRCGKLGIPYLIVHPGAHMGSGESTGVVRAAEALEEALTEAPRGVKVLLENTAGQGSCVGHRFEHLRDIIGACRRRCRLGVCLDTQHAHAAGYPLTTRSGYRRTFAALDRSVGLPRLLAFHLNDSKRPLGVRVDRHENIGLGHLGLEPFRLLVNDPRFDGLPGYLETPALDGESSFARNLRVLRSLLRRRRGAGPAR